VPLFLVSYEEGANGQVDNVYRRMRMKGESIQRQWPDAEIPDDMARRIENKPTDDIELLEATIYDHKRGDYCYHVIDKVSKSELVYRRRKMSPWVISRYMKVAGEIYGRGPLMTALPDIKTLNKTIELLLKNASLAVAGVYTAADDGVLNPNTVKIVPGAIIPVARNGGSQGPALLPLPRSGDFNVSQLVINDLRSNVKRILLDESLPPDNMSARSATEIVERMKELAQNLGSAFGPCHRQDLGSDGRAWPDRHAAAGQWLGGQGHPCCPTGHGSEHGRGQRHHAVHADRSELGY
jgi:hypothetical protein